MLLELRYKDVSDQELVERACKVIDHLLLPSCGVSDMEMINLGCNPQTLLREFAHTWKANGTCRGGLSLPPNAYVPCAELPSSSQIAIGITVSSYFSFTVCIAAMAAIFHYRKSRAVRSNSMILMEVILFGILLAEIAAALLPGEYPSKICGIEYWFIGFGLVIGIGTMLLKVIVLFM
jgi:hypothetical protein